MNDWHAHRVIVVASGPSLDEPQIATVRALRAADQCRVIVTNNTIERLPWADVAFFGDYLAVEHYRRRIGACGLEWWTSSRIAAQRFDVHYVPAEPGNGLGQSVLRMNGNTGGLAINLAAFWGATEIALLGFDMKLDAAGRPHWFGNHPEGLIQTQRFADWIASMQVIARDASDRGIRIVNCTPDTALECFERDTIISAIEAP